MKYSIIMPYYDRIEQLRNTLESFVRLYSDRDDFQVVIVLDNKLTVGMERQYYSLTSEYNEHLQISTIWSSGQNVYNPATAFNEGADWASGEILILTSPECQHEINILAGLDIEFEKTKDVYVVCACKALTHTGKMKMWYQHSEHRNAQYHFCTALSAENYNKVGGFNEEYTSGYGYDDNSFRDRIKRAGIPFINRDDLLTIHQWHEKIRPENWRELLKRNKLLYESEFRDVNCG